VAHSGLRSIFNRLLASRVEVLIAICIATVYLVLALFVLPPDAFFTGDIGVKFLKVQRFVTSNFRDLAIDDPNTLSEVGSRFSPLRQEFSGFYFYRRAGKVYASYSDAFAIISGFLYALMGYKGLYLTSVLPAVGTALLTAHLCKRLGARGSSSAAIVVAFCSPLFFYALVFWEHSISVFFSTLSLFLILVGLKGSRHPALPFSAGVSLGVAGWFRSELYLMAPAIVMGVLLFSQGLSKGWRGMALFALGIAFAWLPLGGFNYVFTGTPLGAHASLNLKEVPNYVRELQGSSRIQYQLDLLWQLLVPTGRWKWMFLLIVIAGTMILISVYNQRKENDKVPARLIGLVVLWIGVVVISLVHLVQQVTLSSLTDVFPLAFFALYGSLTLRREEQYQIVWFFAWTAGLFAVLVAIVAPGAGGMQWGPRYLLPLYPILVLLVWHSLDRLRTRALRRPSRNVFFACFAALLIISFGVQMSGIVRLYHVKIGFGEINHITSQLEPSVFVTPVWWFPQISAPVFNKIQLFGVTTTEELEQLVPLLSAAGVNRFWWVTTSANVGNEAGPTHDLRLDEPLVGTYLLQRHSVSSRYFDIRYKLYEITLASETDKVDG